MFRFACKQTSIRNLGKMIFFQGLCCTCPKRRTKPAIASGTAVRLQERMNDSKSIYDLKYELIINPMTWITLKNLR